MTKITVCGATGKVGRELLALISTDNNLTLAEAISGSGADGTLGLEEADLSRADVIIDFSSPEATMTLLDRLEGICVPLVVGTTGFSAEQAERLQLEALKRPILVGANFTRGFEAFASAACALGRALPDADITVREVYKAEKKKLPSGTTQRLSAELSGISDSEVDIAIERIGDTPGINSVTLDYKVASICLELKVHTRAAYAAGALEAAVWLTGRPNGFHVPKDLLNS